MTENNKIVSDKSNVFIIIDIYCKRVYTYSWAHRKESVMDNKAIWKIRKMQLLIINSVCGAFGIFIAYKNCILSGIVAWLISSWIIGALVSSFISESSAPSILLRKMFDWELLDNVTDKNKNLSKEVTLVCVSVIKQLFTPLLVTVILVYAIISYPFVTAYYFVRAYKEKGRRH